MDADVDALIEALANRSNEAPRIIRGEHGFVPVFSDDYDAVEQERVLQALRDLVESSGTERWPRLIASFGDKRYAFTYGHGGRSPTNATVGGLCQQIADGDVVYAYRRFVPTAKAVLGRRKPLIGEPPELVGAGAIQTWCEMHKGRPLHELQIELCEWAITDGPGLNNLSDEQREKFLEDVKAQIEVLRKTRTAVTDTKRFRGERYATYGSTEIAEIREKYGHAGDRWPTREDERVLLSLFQEVSIDFSNKPLQDAAASFAEISKHRVTLDRDSLKAAGVSAELTLSGTFRNVPLQAALGSLLAPHQLDYLVAGGEIVITTAAAARTRSFMQVHRVGDLVRNETDFENLAKRFRDACPPNSWKDAGGAGSIQLELEKREITVVQTRSNQVRMTQLVRDERAAHSK